MRNYLMVNICIVNCLRASNLMNMIVHDFREAKRDNGIQGACRFYNSKYKTSLVYSEKVILVSDSLYDKMKMYITYVRPIITHDKFRSAKLLRSATLRYIFTSSAEDTESKELMNQMNHSLVSKCITQSFEKLWVFLKTKRYANVSPSRIHFLVITELIILGVGTLDNIAHSFAKHSKESCKKFYVKFSSNREAARLSWKSLQIFTLIKEEEKSAIKMHQSKLSKSSIPTAEKIKSWYHDIRNVLKLSKDLDLTDKGLEGLTQEFSNELTVTEGDQHISNDKEAPEVLPRISVETSNERLNTLLEDNQHFSVETSAETVSGLKSVNDSNIPQKILADFGSLSPPNKSLSKEEQHEEPEDDNDHTITITTTKEKVIKFIKNNLGQIKKFLTTEENKYLTKETSLPNGHWVHC